MRRRLRRQQRVREALLLDLGALVFELHRQGRREPELLQAKAAELTAVEDEVRALSQALGADTSAPQLTAPGIAESCSSCGALLTSDARFCSNCGASTGLALAGEPAASAPAEDEAPAEPEAEAPTTEAEPVDVEPVEDTVVADEPPPEAEAAPGDWAPAPEPDPNEGIVSVSPLGPAEEEAEPQAETEPEAEAEPAPDADPGPEAAPDAEPEPEEPDADEPPPAEATDEPAEVGLEDFGGEEPAPDATPPGSEEHAAPAPPAQSGSGDDIVQEARRLARIARRRARSWLERQRS